MSLTQSPAHRAHCTAHQCCAVAQVAIVRRHAGTACDGHGERLTLIQKPTWMCTRCLVKVRAAWGALPTNAVTSESRRIKKTSTAFAKILNDVFDRLGVL